MKSILVSVLCFTLSFYSFGQGITQTIRGTILDTDSNIPLPGASIIVLGVEPFIGAVTDINGAFRLENVPIGRVNLKITFVGYEDRVIPNLLVSSAKEEVLAITLTESVSRLEEVVISANETRGEVINEMALVSAHTFSVEETQRYAGSFDDPARMVVAFAGVNGNAEGDNDIIVRGNSPKGILWRLEGVAIPNPNHFAGEGTTGGPINALSSKMLSNSDFFTGAFTAEYGDVTSGVFDMRLKRGNNEKREYTAALSTLGIDVTAEGPFRKGDRSAYIFNYRYSALDLLDRAGIVDFGGVPRYQDMSFKLHLPLNNRHYFSVFGVGGLSGIDAEDTEGEGDEITGKFDGDFQLGVVGATHSFQMNNNMYLKSVVAATGSGNRFQYSIPDDGVSFLVAEEADISKSSFIASSAFNYKLNAQHKVESGVIVTRHNYNIESAQYDFQERQIRRNVGESGGANVFQAYALWKFRINDALTVVNGLHYLNFALNDKYSVEPRVALRWDHSETQSFNVGFGLHSRIEPVSAYLVQKEISSGETIRPNENLGMTRAAHFVAGYNRKLSRNTHLKAEVYYQKLFDVPVENADTSTFSLVNQVGGITTRELVNAGTGKNYGVELTLERYLDKGLYYMTTLSLFRSLYTPLDGVERKSAFDNNYIANFLGGKEFAVGNPAKNKVLFINAKLALIGGKRYSPIDVEASVEKGWGVIDERNPFGIKGDDIFRTDFSIGLRRNRERVTTEWKFDVQNILNNQVVVDQYYVQATQSVRKSTQLGMLPTVTYKVSF